MTSDPATATASGQSAPDYAARYETLRSYAMERHAPTSRDGLIVLLRQGVAAWMDAWSQLAVTSPRPAPNEHQQPPPLPDKAGVEVVRVLAAMTLEHIQEVQA